VNLAPKPRNVLIEWAAPEVIIREQVENLGVREVSEEEYAQLVLEAKAKGQAIPTTTPLKKPVPIPILFGDVEYLKLVDLKSHGLGEYEEQVKKRELQVVNSNASIASVSVPVHASSDLTNQESHRHLNIEQIGSNFIL